MQHLDLFGSTCLTSGLTYREDFVTRDEETVELLAAIRALPLQEARYRRYTARRRTINFGAAYDFQRRRATPAPALPEFLDPIRSVQPNGSE